MAADKHKDWLGARAQFVCVYVYGYVCVCVCVCVYFI